MLTCFQSRRTLAALSVRLLDKEYSNAIRAGGDVDFDWTKLFCVRELAGEVVEEFMVQAATKLDESRKKSWTASFNTFRHERERTKHIE